MTPVPLLRWAARPGHRAPDRGALARLRAGRTVLVIAHRATTIERLPRVVRLHAGRLREEPCR